MERLPGETRLIRKTMRSAPYSIPEWATAWENFSTTWCVSKLIAA